MELKYEIITDDYDDDYDDDVVAGSVPNLLFLLLLVLLLQDSTSYPFVVVSSRTSGIKRDVIYTSGTTALSRTRGHFNTTLKTYVFPSLVVFSFVTACLSLQLFATFFLPLVLLIFYALLLIRPLFAFTASITISCETNWKRNTILNPSRFSRKQQFLYSLLPQQHVSPQWDITRLARIEH